MGELWVKMSHEIDKKDLANPKYWDELLKPHMEKMTKVLRPDNKFLDYSKGNHTKIDSSVGDSTRQFLYAEKYRDGFEFHNNFLRSQSKEICGAKSRLEADGFDVTFEEVAVDKQFGFPLLGYVAMLKRKR